MSRRCFVYRADDLIHGRHIYLVIPDRGEAPALERPLRIFNGTHVFVFTPEELVEIVDEQERGLAAVLDVATLPLCIGDPALAEEGARHGLELAVPSPSVVRTATAGLLAGVWGRQAAVIQHTDVLVRLLEAARSAAAISPDHSPTLHVEFAGSTHHRHRSPHSTLIRAAHPSGDPGLLLALYPDDVPLIEQILAERRYEELCSYDFIHVAFLQAPAYAARLCGILHGWAAVPVVTRAHGGEYVLLSDEDVLTLACALELFAQGTATTLVAGSLEITGRVLAPNELPRIAPDILVRVKIPDVPDEAFLADGTLLEPWDDYFAAACHAAVGELSAAYAKLDALRGSPDPSIRDLSIEAAAALSLELSHDELDQLRAAARQRDPHGPS